MALTARNRPHRKWKRDEKLNRGQRRTRLRDGWRHSPRLGHEPRARACWRALGQGRAARGSWGHTQAVLCHLGPQRRHSHCLGPPKVEQEGREAQLSSSSAPVSPQLLPSPQPSGSHLARQPGTGGFLSYRETMGRPGGHLGEATGSVSNKPQWLEETGNGDAPREREPRRSGAWPPERVPRCGTHL